MLKALASFIFIFAFGQYVAAQNLVAGEYFYDADPGPGMGIAFNLEGANSIDKTLTLNTTGLAIGFHTLCIRIKDSQGQWGIAEARTLMVQSIPLSGPSKIKFAEYFFDTDPGPGNGISLAVTNTDSLQATMDISAAGLNKGFHQLVIRLQNEAGAWGIAESRNFFVDGSQSMQPDSIVAGEYFIGTDPGGGNGIPFQVSKGVLVDTLFSYMANNLSFGDYTIGIRLQNTKGSWGYSETRKFRTCETYGPLAKFEVVKDGNKVSLLNRAEYATGYKWVLNQGDSIATENPYFELPSGDYKILMSTQNQCGTDTASKLFAIEGLKGVFPNVVGNGGVSTLEIKGYGFTAGAVFMLKKGDYAIPTGATVFRDANTIITTVYPENAPKGFYRLEVQIPNLPLLVLDSALEVKDVVAPTFVVNIEIPDRIRTGNKVIVRVKTTNTGNVDALGIPLIISGIPVLTNTRLLNDTFLLPEVEMTPPPGIRFDGVFMVDTPNNNKMLPLIIPRLAPQETYTIEFLLQSFIPSGGFNLRAAAFPPLYAYDASASPPTPSKSGEVNLLSNNCAPPAAQTCVECLATTTAKLAYDAAKIFAEGPLANCIIGIADLGLDFRRMLQELSCPQNFTKDEKMGVGSVLNFVANTSITVLNCAAAGSGAVTLATLVGVVVKKVMDGYGAVQNGPSLVNAALDVTDCLDNECKEPKNGIKSKISSFLSSWDPNEKVGPGYANQSFITSTTPIVYRVAYENVDTAALPAQTVIVYDTLNLNMFDPSAVQFIDAGVGRKLVYFKQTGLSAIAEIDLRPTVDQKARINAIVDTTTGVIQWHVQTIDPLTNQETEDQLAGFLLPNDSTNRGDGYFTFSVAKRGAVSEQNIISNRATIIFDANPPIHTNAWVNGFDDTAPVSQVNSLPAISASDTVKISFSGSDNASGIDYYDLWVSVDEGAFEPWVNRMAADSLTFVGIYGHKYAFYCVATDRSGNREIKSPQAETTIEFMLTPTSFEFMGNGSFSDPANWKDGKLPPKILPAGSSIVINPTNGGECLLDRVQEIRQGANFNVVAGKKLVFVSWLNLE